MCRKTSKPYRRFIVGLLLGLVMGASSQAASLDLPASSSPTVFRQDPELISAPTTIKTDQTAPPNPLPVETTEQPSDQQQQIFPPDNDRPTEENSRLDQLEHFSSGGSLLGTPLPPLPEPLQQLKQPSDPDSYVVQELVAVTASMDDAKRLAQILASSQARAIRRRKLTALGMVISTFRVSAGQTAPQVRQLIRESYPSLWIDLNHIYRPAAKEDDRTSLYQGVGLNSRPDCGKGLRIGLLDGPIDQNHPALKGQKISQKTVFSRGRKAAKTRHATAIASLLVGNPALAGLGGLVSHATLLNAIVMQQDKQGHSFTSAENLLTGIDWLVSQQVQVINISLGGERNALVEAAIQRVTGIGIGIVAAAGNGGSDAMPSYPAAEEMVIAVTAVDRENRIAPAATKGDYIDLAAPGVDLWVAAENQKSRYMSGTSMAAPLVSAALAQLGGHPEQGKQLFQQARDLGAPGKDPVYGWGLLQFPACEPTAKAKPTSN